MNKSTVGPQVVRREDIRNLATVEKNGIVYSLGEHRDLRRHPFLSSFLPESGRTSVSWTKLEPGQCLETHTHPTASMILVCKGEGFLVGDLEQELHEGDVVAIPPLSKHGFIGGNTSALHCLSIQFEDLGLYENEHEPLVKFSSSPVKELLKKNEERLKQHIATPFFALLSDGTLENPKCQELFVSLLKGWSSKFQTILHARSALSEITQYKDVFTEHFREEVGHDSLLQSTVPTLWDPIIESCADWFLCRMITGENAERLGIIHIVLEQSAHEFHERAANALNTNKNYFQIHADHDEGHAKLGMHLLEDLTAQQLAQVDRTCEKAWQILDTMLEQMNQRIRSVSR